MNSRAVLPNVQSSRKALCMTRGLEIELWNRLTSGLHILCTIGSSWSSSCLRTNTPSFRICIQINTNILAMEYETCSSNDQGINWITARFEEQSMYNILNMFTATKKVWMSPRCLKLFFWIYLPYDALIHKTMSEVVRNQHFGFNMAVKFLPVAPLGPKKITILKRIIEQTFDCVWLYVV